MLQNVPIHGQFMPLAMSRSRHRQRGNLPHLVLM